jgi:hypothetical protein
MRAFHIPRTVVCGTWRRFEVICHVTKIVKTHTPPQNPKSTFIIQREHEAIPHTKDCGMWNVKTFRSDLSRDKNIIFQSAFRLSSRYIYCWLLVRKLVCIHHFPHAAAWFCVLSVVIARSERDDYCAETSFRLWVKRSSPSESAGVSAHSAARRQGGSIWAFSFVPFFHCCTFHTLTR